MSKGIEESIRHHLRSARVAQLATSENNVPWICSVYIVSDDTFNIYWLSFPDRRHSKELTKNSNVSMAVAIKHDQPVIGLQVEGVASIVNDGSVVRRIMDQYIATHDGAGKDFYKKFLKKENRHQMYKLSPSKINLFDEVHFPGGYAHVIKLST